MNATQWLILKDFVEKHLNEHDLEEAAQLSNEWDSLIKLSDIRALFKNKRIPVSDDILNESLDYFDNKVDIPELLNTAIHAVLFQAAKFQVAMNIINRVEDSAA
ncbi:hypothetical protein ACLMPP_12455 [Yersinia enterocolitica]|uniref:hypothetical protein n=1 Tax=Yersinia enterocolitica TaxID=630 RepID=UPI00398C835D